MDDRLDTTHRSVAFPFWNEVALMVVVFFFCKHHSERKFSSVSVTN
jgi:hypothetical protein